MSNITSDMSLPNRGGS